MGAGQAWARLDARLSVGHPSFWERARAPTQGPSGVLSYVVSARQVHLPRYLYAAHASTLVSPAPSAPYGNDRLLPDLSDTHGSPSADASFFIRALETVMALQRDTSKLLKHIKLYSSFSGSHVTFSSCG